jgi:FtsP/CotA-like multicopper oxidase with cupredoxin domain
VSDPDEDMGPTTGGPLSSLARRRFLQLAGTAVFGGIAASLLDSCSSSSASDSASSEVTPSSAQAPSNPAATAAPRNEAPATTFGQSVAAVVIDGTLPIPPLLDFEDQEGTKVFRLTLQKGDSTFLADQTTATFGFNGDYLGPTLRAVLGDRVRIDVTNELGETSTVHWHGMHLPAAMDGGPHQTIADTSTWSPEFTIQQPAATLWYHPHMMGQTLQQVGMGLAGLFILDDDDSAQIALPSVYGVDDIPLILQAKTFGADGQFVLNGGGRRRRDGDRTTLVNGAISPTINTPDPRLRLRVLNASSQEFYNLGFAGDVTFYQVASDGGHLPAPVALTRLILAPAERAEIVVDVDPSNPTVLQGFGGNGGGRGGTNFQTGPLLTINPTQTSGTAAALPVELAIIERLSPDDAAQTREFVLGGDDRDPTINGQSMTSMADMMDMANVIRVALDTIEVWNVVNRSDDTHAFHVHDIQFQILQRDGAPPAASESGRKDTVMVRPRETVRLIMRFADFADATTPYMYHCHLLNHEDNGMMGQFLVV